MNSTELQIYTTAQVQQHMREQCNLLNTRNFYAPRYEFVLGHEDMCVLFVSHERRRARIMLAAYVVAQDRWAIINCNADHAFPALPYDLVQRKDSIPCNACESVSAQ